jgi:small-conductance mechanosensitive channel
MGSFSANVLSALPEFSYTLPWLGEINFTPYLAAFGIFVGLSVLTKVILVLALKHLKHLSTKTKTDIDDVVINALSGIRAWVYTLVSFYIALQFFSVPEMVSKVISGAVLFAVAWQAIEVILCFIDYATVRFLEKDEDGDGQVDPNAATASHMVTLLARLVLWALGIIFVLSNLGIEVTSLIAGLGIGGVAIAFALQGVLSDLFASFSIYADKPFRIGDYIVLGTDSGTVEKIGIKSTRIRTLQGEELVVSNAELTTARVQNFKRMEERRIVSQFGVIYETPLDKLKEIPGMVTRIFEDVEGARLDRVHFTTLGDFSLNFEVVFYIESSDYSRALDIQQNYNLTLMERFAEVGIEFAYPTSVQFNKSL